VSARNLALTSIFGLNMRIRVFSRNSNKKEAIIEVIGLCSSQKMAVQVNTIYVIIDVIQVVLLDSSFSLQILNEKDEVVKET